MSKLRDKLLKQTTRETKKITIPDGFPLAGEIFYIQGMSTAERANFDDKLTTKKGRHNKSAHRRIRELIIIACVVDEDGKKMFTDKDLDQLSKVDARVCNYLGDACAEMAGITDNDVELLSGN